jgi:3-hydroxyisobutyrate dehydrogenase-like beta-hydroxyacid dehydrogenase
VRVGASVADAVDGSDAVLVSLPHPDADRAVLLGDRGAFAAARPGTLFVDTSTIDPPTARELYAAAVAAGLDYVEAPISGGEPLSAGMDGARKGNVTFMAGGDEPAFRRAETLFALLGAHWFHLGPAGTGATVKLVSNHLSGLYNLLGAEAFAVARAAGVEWDVLFRVFRHTDASSYWLFNYFEPRIRRGDFEPGFSVDLQHKDHRLFGELAASHAVPAPFNELALDAYGRLRAAGRGGRDVVDAIHLALGEVDA